MLRSVRLSMLVAFTACGSSSGGAAPDGGPALDASVDGHHVITHDASAGKGDVGASRGPSSAGSSGSTATSSSSSSNGSSSGQGDTGGGSSGDGGPPPVGASVTQFHNHVNRDGLFVDGAITLATAPNFALDASFAGTFTGNVYASPLYVESGPGGKGAFYVATESGTVFALDETTGAIVWQKNVGATPTSTGAGCGNISPIGITGTPAIDLTTRRIVFDAASDDGSGNIKTHTIWALSIDDGSVAWSVDASTMSSGGTTFTPQTQNQRGAVLIVGGIAYVVYGGHYGDCGTYHGWIIGVPLSGQGAKAWATTAPGAGTWGVGGASSDGESVYMTTGNGKGGGASWAESEGIFRLDPGPSYAGATADYFAPYNWQTLDQHDTDLSGSGPLVIDAPALTPSALVLAQGKDGFLYLVDRTNLGGIATSTQLANVGALKVQSGEITNGAASATIAGVTYVVVRPNGTQGGVGCPSGMSGDLVGVKLDPTAASKMSVVWCVSSGGIGSPSITTSDGTNDPIVWTLGADNGGTGLLAGWNLTTGAAVTSGGAASNKAAHVRRFTAPIAVHGRMFVAGDGRLYAYKAPQ